MSNVLHYGLFGRSLLPHQTLATYFLLNFWLILRTENSWLLLWIGLFRHIDFRMQSAYISSTFARHDANNRRFLNHLSFRPWPHCGWRNFSLKDSYSLGFVLQFGRARISRFLQNEAIFSFLQMSLCNLLLLSLQIWSLDCFWAGCCFWAVTKLGGVVQG